MKKIVSCIIFIAIFILSFNKVNEISLDKINNRYYMLREELKTIDQEFDVQIFGSCHAYTSFNPIQFKNEYSIDSYNYANPGEIMPVTYLNIKEKIDIHKPKVILVDLWGMFADDTYIESEVIYTTYFPIRALSIFKSEGRNHQ